MNETKKGKTVSRSVQRAIAVLGHVGENNNGIGVTQIANDLKLDKSTVHRLLRTLVDTGLITHDPRSRSYSLGTRLIRYGLYAQERFELPHTIRPFLNQLRDLTNETAGLTLRIGRHRATLVQSLSHQQPRATFALGNLLPLDDSAAAQVMRAFDPEYPWDQLNGAYSSPENSPEVWRKIEEVRTVGHAVSEENVRPGWDAIAFPLLDVEGTFLGALAVVGPAERWTVERIKSVATDCQDLVTEAGVWLGKREPPNL